jgi:dolichol-phosphate mannosyltransferase
LDLTVIIPVYNEQEIIRKVVHSWIDELESLQIDYVIKVYNDGSKDSTLRELNEMKDSFRVRLVVIDKANSGHGPTILQGYMQADSEWIFQVDSDDEIESKYFRNLWNARKQYDMIIGVRDGRKSSLPREVITLATKFTVALFYATGISDPNSPYRLYRTNKFRTVFCKLPLDTFAPNVILSGYAAFKKMRILQVKVPFKERQTGEVSIRKLRLLRAALKSWKQTVFFRISLLGKNNLPQK